MKIQLIIKDGMKSSFVVTYAVQIVRMIIQLILGFIKFNIGETHEARISKNLEIDYRICRKENG